MITENKVNFEVTNKNWKKIMSYGILYDSISLTLRELKLFSVELTVRFSNNMEIKSFNKKWRKNNIETNVLAFPNYNKKGLAQPINYIGDIIVSFNKIKQESIKYNISFKDHSIHLIIHGVLHLLGYDHDNPKSEKTMIAFEKKILNMMNINNSILNSKYDERT